MVYSLILPADMMRHTAGREAWGIWSLIMESNEKQIWFPAKRYGWGWGLPCAWQGLVTLLIWLALLGGGAALLLPSGHFGVWITFVIILTVVLFFVCLAKGETPRWRWGKD